MSAGSVATPSSTSKGQVVEKGVDERCAFHTALGGSAGSVASFSAAAGMATATTCSPDADSTAAAIGAIAAPPTIETIVARAIDTFPPLRPCNGRSIHEAGTVGAGQVRKHMWKVGSATKTLSARINRARERNGSSGQECNNSSCLPIPRFGHYFLRRFNREVLVLRHTDDLCHVRGIRVEEWGCQDQAVSRLRLHPGQFPPAYRIEVEVHGRRVTRLGRRDDSRGL